MSAARSVVEVLGVPTSLGQQRCGVDAGPKALRDGGIVKALEECGAHVVDLGDVALASTALPDDESYNCARNVRSIGRYCADMARRLVAAQLRGSRTLVLGGDHSLGAGSIAATLEAHPTACVIWVDAHGDINTPEISPSGNVHGMPVAFAAGLGTAASAPGFEWITRKLPLDRIVWVGIRDLDAKEKQFCREHGLRMFTMHDIDKHGIARVMEMALKAVDPAGVRPIHLSFDIDALDPTHAPSTGTLKSGGMTLREGRYIAEALGDTGRLVHVDMVEVNPLLRPDGLAVTVESAITIVQAAFGLRLA